MSVTTSWPIQIAFCVALSYIFIDELLTAPPGHGSATICTALLVTVLEGCGKERKVIEQ